jgi:putative transposase
MKRYGRPEVVVTSKLRSYRSALRELGRAGRPETGKRRNNRAENSHQPLRRREKIMTRFRSARSLQKFAVVHSSLHNHFNLDQHPHSRPNFKGTRVSALAEWRQLAA